MMKHYRDLFEEEISRRIAAMAGESVDLVSRDIHIACGGYPGKHHRMPQCCEAMYRLMAGDDQVLNAPASGKGAYVTVRYYKRNH